MASAEMTEFEKIRQPWTLLSSTEEVNQQKDNKEYKDKLIVIIFNSSTVPRFSVELELKGKRHKYENDPFHVKFFKCNVLEASEELPTAFKVTQIPTFIFYRNGKECARLKKPTEKDLFEKLDQLSTTPPEQQNS